MNDKSRISLVGPGAVGLTITRFLQNKGYPIVSVVGRTEESIDRVEKYLGHVTYSTELKDALPDGDIVLTAVSDNAIPEVCDEFAALSIQKKTFIHFSGFRSYRDYEALEKRGAETGSMHPLQSFIHIEESVKSLPGTHYVIEGTPEALTTARQLISDLEGEPITINPDLKVLYHAGACISANYFVSLLRLSEKFFKKSGVESEKIIPALIPLLKGILRNIETRGTLESITGPIARGDHQTLSLQLNTIRKNFPQHLPIFRALSLLCANAVFEKPRTNPDLIDEIMWLLEQNLMEDTISSESEEMGHQKNRNS